MEDKRQQELDEGLDRTLTDEPCVTEVEIKQEKKVRQALTRLEKESKFGWRDLVLLLGYFPIQVIVIFILTFINIFTSIASNGGQMNVDATVEGVAELALTGTAIAGLLTVIYILIAYKEFFKAQWTAFKGNAKKNILYIIGSYLAAQIVMILFSYLVTSETSGNQALIETMFSSAGVFQYVLLIFSTVVVAPIVEEMLTRKIIVGNVLAKKNKVLTICMILLSSLIFGMLHFSGFGENWFLLLIPYMFMGGAFATAYALTDNVFVPIGAHFLNNFIAVVLMFIFI